MDVLTECGLEGACTPSRKDPALPHLRSFARAVSDGKYAGSDFWETLLAFITSRTKYRVSAILSGGGISLSPHCERSLRVVIPLGLYSEHELRIRRGELSFVRLIRDGGEMFMIGGAADSSEIWSGWWGYMKSPMLPVKLLRV